MSDVKLMRWYGKINFKKRRYPTRVKKYPVPRRTRLRNYFIMDEIWMYPNFFWYPDNRKKRMEKNDRVVARLLPRANNIRQRWKQNSINRT